jgi:hypothetical protein
MKAAWTSPGLFDGLAAHSDRGLKNLLRVVLDPARLRVDLSELNLRRGDGSHVLRVEHDGARGRRALVYGEYVGQKAPVMGRFTLLTRI